ncbi:MAG TPA: superoxide dismutase family protein [Candidatus Dormibacteraeota bacterium]|nr:superoxide dismutase family protein [Candidatus Dormibacteraeota bacterium]
MRRLSVVAAIFVLSACGYSTARTTSPSDPYFEGTTSSRARAAIVDSSGKPIGLASFSETRLGVLVDVKVVSLPKGAHGLHIHATGKCETPEFMSAGAHFNPGGNQHGLHNAKGPHAGDLPNLVVGDDGKGALSYVDPLVTLESGASNSIVGLSLVVHKDPDDEQTDPAGNSGSRIACGVIDKTA